MDSEDSDPTSHPTAAGVYRKIYTSCRRILVLEKGVWTVKRRSSLWLLKMYAAASVFRNFQKKKKQNIVSGVRFMYTETTVRQACGWSKCMLQLVFLEIFKRKRNKT